MRRWKIPVFSLLLLIYATHGITIDCEFGVENHSLIGDVYVCKAKDLIITRKNEIVHGIDGEHLSSKLSNLDVKVFHADDLTIRYFPAELENFFPNLQGIKVVRSGVKELSADDFKHFSMLEFCDFKSNEIESLDDENLFIFNTQLKEISFDSNKIKHVAENIFEPLLQLTSISFKNNDCIDEMWIGETEVETGKKKLLEKCPTNLDDSSIVDGFEMGKNEASKSEYEIGSTKEKTVRKISRLGSSSGGQWSIDLNFFEKNHKPLEITCDLSVTFWKYSEADLFTCSIVNQAIDFPGYKIQITLEEGAKVKALNFDDNKGVKFLPSNIAEVFPNLVELSVKHTYLESLSGKLFEGLGQLKRMSLNNHDLKVIENENFAGLYQLEVLDLSEGNIRFIDEGGFSELKSLKSLNIGANKLKILQPKTFDGLTMLQNVSIELNHLIDVDNALFGSNKNLVSIWLNDNKIIALSPAAFENINELNHVDLSGNECIDGIYDDDEESNFDVMKKVLEENCSSTYVIRKTYRKIKVYSEGDESTKHEKIRSEFNIEGDEDESELSVINKITTQYFESSDVDVSEDFTTESFVIGPQVSEEEATTLPPTTQTLIIKNNPETKKVTCDFEELQWYFSDEKLKTCVIDNQMVDSKGFTIMPALSVEDVRALTIANNQLIKILPEKISENFPNLLELSARNSSLSLLSKKNFEGLSHLKSLNLANNNIKFIESDTFDDLKSLEELDLSSNSMEYIDEALFSKLKSLKTLRLSGNKLHFVHPKMFRDLRNLQNISLSSNQLSTIDENIFKTNKNLKNIWLQNNKIKSLSPNIFNPPKNLEYVDLRENKCIDTAHEKSSFEAMKTDILGKCGEGYVLKSKQKKIEKKKKEKVKPTTELEVEENGIGCDYDLSGDVFWPSLNETLFTCVVFHVNHTIDGQNFKIFANSEPYPLPLIDGDKIQAITFQNNKNIKFLPQNVGESFPNLLAISATNDAIENISKENFKNLRKLKSLNLSGNKIKSIPADTFEYLTNLEELILENNEIEYIELETTFVILKFLKRFRIAGNKLANFDPNLFDGINKLQEVSFDLDEDPSEEWVRRFPNLKFTRVSGQVFGNPKASNDVQETTTEIDDEDISEVSCSFVEYFSPVTNSMLTTCEIDNELVIESERWKIKPSTELSRVKRFNINGNKNVKYLPENFSESFPKLIEVSVVNSGLLGLKRYNFDGLNNLKSIDFSGNSLKHLEPDTFEDLKSLEYLNLANNNMEFIEEVLLHYPYQLKKIYMSGNKIHYIHANTFRKLKNLEDVDLKNNLLSVIEPSSFKHNLKLQNIDLSDNKIESVSHKVFGRKKQLQTVNFSGNRCIDRIFNPETFDEMKKTLKENCEPKATSVEITCEDDSCVMNNQVIENFEYSITSPEGIDASRVKSITFNGPNIKYLPSNTGKVFPNLEKLTTVDTSLVSLSKENFRDLPKLKTLNLTGVESFEPDTFDALGSLKNFNLDSDVEEIDDQSFSQLVSLETIYLITKRLRRLNPKVFETMTELTEVEITFEPDENEQTIEIGASLIRKNPKLKLLKFNGKVVMEENPDEGEIEHLNKEGEDKPKPVVCDFEDELSSQEKLSCSLKNQIIDKEKPPTQKQTDNKKSSATTPSSNIQTNQEKPKIHVSQPERTSTTRRPTAQNPQQKEVTCFLSHSSWPNERLITCDLNDQAVADTDIVIAEKPYDSKVQAFRVKGNKNFKFFPENLSKFKLLKRIAVTNSSLEAIFPDDFIEMKALKSLDLSNNNLEAIEAGTFIDLNSLEDLNLSENEIEYLDEDTFDNLENLKTLNLKGNKINFIHPNTFDHLPELTDLNLEGNSLPTISEEELFKNNPKLENVKLSIKHNLKAKTTKRPEKVIEIESKKKIPCKFSDSYWQFIDSNLFTCDIKNSIESSNMKIKESPRNQRVKGLNFMDNKDIKFLPENLGKVFPNIIGISGFNSSLETIDRDNFQDLQNLKYLNMANSKLKSINPNTFDGLSSLEELDLSGNQIDELDESTFEKLINLKTLYLGGNLLRRIPSRIFENLPNLRNISLENNQIQSIDPSTFKNNPLLEIVWLSGNKIKKINPKTFEGLKKLEYLDLRGNDCIDKYFGESSLRDLKNELVRKCHKDEIRVNESTFRTDTKSSIPRNTKAPKNPKNYKEKNSQPKEIFCDLNYADWSNEGSKSLFTCTIKDQVIENVDDFIKSSPHGSYVQAIRFDNNKLQTELPKNVGNVFPNLIQFSAKNTSLTSLKPESFKNLDDVKVLDFSDNKIETIEPNTFTSLPSAVELNLNHNRIFTIKESAFPKYVENLNLGNNKLSTVDPKIFQNLPQLSTVDLKNNNIRQISESTFRNNPKLQNILLGGNHIKQMSPNTFENLPNLKVVNLEENDCISGVYGSRAMKALKIDISRNCQTPTGATQPESNEVSRKEFYQVTPSTEEKYDRQERVDPFERVEIFSHLKPTQISCEFSDTLSPFSNSYEFTCNVKSQPLESSRFEEKPENQRVKRVTISDKKMKKLPKDIGKGFPSMTELSFEGSSIKTLSPEDFQNMPQLKFLDLSNNELTSIVAETFNDLPSLENLNLRRNKLKFFTELEISTLKVLSLEGNELRYLDPNTFSKLPRLISLDLENNHLSSIDESVFKSNPKLKTISLASNRIQSISPKVFESLRELNTVDLSKNDCVDFVFTQASTSLLSRELEQKCASCENLKTQLMTCKREKDITMKSGPKLFDSLKKEGEKLKLLLKKSEEKVNKLHEEVKRHRNASINEKNKAKQLSDKAKNLEKEIENLKNSLKACAKIDGNHNFLVDVNCDFESNANDYTCNAKNLVINKENSTIESIDDDHEEKKQNPDVTSLIILDQSTKFLPNGISSKFPQLTKLAVENSKLSKINRPAFENLNHLTSLVIRQNQINSIEPFAFDEIPQLVNLDLRDNNIHSLPAKIFEKLRSLKSIILSDNEIKSLPFNVIPAKNNIENFLINNNKLAKIDPRISKRLLNADSIDFKDNDCINGKVDAGEDNQNKITLFGEMAMNCLSDDEDNGFCGLK